MSNSYRIRTQVGVNKRINVQLEQDFDYLEILSLKLLPNQIYQRKCSDYGVIVGRVTANNGFGVPNVKVSVFTPLTDQDSLNPVISDLYPYKSISDLDEDGYRYNLLPKTQSHSGHVPVGTFFSREDVLTNPSIIEVFDKYYRYTALTNDSGDFMIFGVPVGDQLVHIDVDLSDIGEFSLAPQDLIRMGIATESQIAGNKFRQSTNLNELVQLVSFNRNLYVAPLWGEPEICNLSINRLDFDLTAESNINITPTAIFMGSIFSSTDDQFQKRNCKPKIAQGELCSLVAGPGQILAIRQTANLDDLGRPILEQYDLEQGGQVIDDNGTWLVDLPMNLDYVSTNEFGERIVSNDPKIGIPTRAKYRFKIKWNQSPKLSEPIKRAYFLVPNVREYGWTSGGSVDPLKSGSATSGNTELAFKSYAFSLDWEDYADIQAAIDCEDSFYPFLYNKVYTVSQLIDQYRKGFLPNRIIAVRNILDQTCESTNVKFPTNDSVYRFDLIYLLFIILLFITKPILYLVLIIAHAIAGILEFFGSPLWRKVAFIQIPNITYPECDLCECNLGRTYIGNGPTDFELNVSRTLSENAFVTPFNSFTNYICSNNFGITQLLSGNQDYGIQNPFAQAPQLEQYQRSPLYQSFTTSLPLFERINLFNVKSKYFNGVNSNNPGGGFNRIKVNFAPTLNGYPSINNNVLGDTYYNIEVNSGNYQITTTDYNPTIQPMPNIVLGPQNPIYNVYNQTTSTYTVKSPGRYRIEVTINGLNTNTANSNWSIYFFEFYRNNTVQTYQEFPISTSNLYPATHTNVYEFDSNLNDTFDIRYTFGADDPFPIGPIVRPLVSVTMKVTTISVFNQDSELHYHLDKPMVMFVKPDKVIGLTPGTIISFQDPSLSSDININNGILNEFGTNGITGTSINNGSSFNPAQIIVNYANPNADGTNIPTTYNIIQNENDAQYAKFSMDIEYFQVITAITVNRYLQLVYNLDPTTMGGFTALNNYRNSQAGSLLERIVRAKMDYHILKIDHCWLEPSTTLEYRNCYEDFDQQYIVFMVRGVDPYSSRMEVEYDLSLLFDFIPDSSGKPKGQVVVRGNNYKLNIPIQGHYACTRHDKLTNNLTTFVPDFDVTGIDPIIGGNGRLYYPSYHFQPDVDLFSGFTSTLPNYYSSLSSDYVNLPLQGYLNGAPTLDGPCARGTIIPNLYPNSYGYLRVKDTNNTGTYYNSPPFRYSEFGNGFLFRFDNPNNDIICLRYRHNNNDTNSIERNRGYFLNEIVDGGSVMYQILNIMAVNQGNISAKAYHYSPRYDLNNQYNYNNCALTGRIVMRSDRLPTSTNLTDNLQNSYLFQANPLFTFFEIFDDGSFNSSGGQPVGSPTFGDPNQTIDNFGTGNTILDTFTCSSMVPLGCYYVPTINGNPSNEIDVRDKPNDCYNNGYNDEEILKNGCYVFITAPFNSLDRDLRLLTEWISRTQIIFGACRNVWSHIFTNNWINGSLYAFSFKNDRFFTAPNTIPLINANKPYSEYCKDTIVLHPTNNFYYRSSPYLSATTSNSAGRFIGGDRPETDPFLQIFGINDYGGNRRNLKFPTTIMDMGPRSQYIQELVFSDAYDGYIMNRLSETTYKDVSEILNYFIISRLANENFIKKMYSPAGVTIMDFFQKRDKNFVDADYSQMISINSEIAVNEFESINYPPIDNQQDPIFFNSPLSEDPVIGIYYSSDTQTRDFITPKRTIINPLLSIGTQCAFNYYDNFSQYVPFYQWRISQNRDYDSIFGSRENDWYTRRMQLTGLTPTQIQGQFVETFFYHRYQSLDRIESNSRYYRPRNTSYSKDFKGYIYNVDYDAIGFPPRTTTGPTDFEYETNWIPTPNPTNQEPIRVFTVGAPFHFYFGLKKGKTAFDRFAKKWLDLEAFTD